MHLTCVGATTDEIDAVARQYRQAGVRHIGAARRSARRHRRALHALSRRLCLRRRPGGGAAPRGRFRDQRRRLPGDASRGRVAGWNDLDNLEAQARRRRDAGDHAVFLRSRLLLPLFRAAAGHRGADRARPAADRELRPGPATSASAAAPRCRTRCTGASPAWTPTRPRISASVETAAEMIRALVRGGIDALYIYTLNRAERPATICDAGGLAPSTPKPDRARAAFAPSEIRHDRSALRPEGAPSCDGAMGRRSRRSTWTSRATTWARRTAPRSWISLAARPRSARSTTPTSRPARTWSQTNTFGGSPITLAEFDLQDEALELEHALGRSWRARRAGFSSRTAAPRFVAQLDRPRHQAAHPGPYRLPDAGRRADGAVPRAAWTAGSTRS